MKRWVFGVVVAVLVALSARNAMATDPRELRAREAFAAQRYQDALDLFAKLYAETLHPIYLRNIGRCYQNLGQPDHAITSFRDYLHKAKNLPADETREIEGYIKEMQDLKRRQEASAAEAKPAPKADEAEASSAPVKPLPSASPPPPPPQVGGAATSVIMTAPPPPPAEESSPFYTRWWFWTIVGGVAAAGLGVAFATGAFTKTQDASCPPGRTCQ
jgi:tetratricopeptide (TPR) repeat protein